MIMKTESVDYKLSCVMEPYLILILVIDSQGQSYINRGLTAELSFHRKVNSR